MSVELTNLTQSRCNVPFNSGAEPRYTLAPGQSLVVSDEYLLALDEDARARFLRVTTGDAPLFKLTKLDELLEQAKADTVAADARKTKKRNP